MTIQTAFAIILINLAIWVKSGLSGGLTPLATAAERGRMREVVKNFTPFEVARFYELELDGKLVNDGLTPLHWAIVRKHYDVVDFFLKNGIRPDALDRGGRTALHLAASLSDERSVRLLLEHGASINYPHDDTGSTPLYLGIKSKRYFMVPPSDNKVVKLLLENGADPNTVGYGGTALHTAIELSDKDLVELLFRYDPNLEHKKRSHTPLQLAISMKERDIALKLIEKGAKVNCGLISLHRDLRPIRLAEEMEFDQEFLEILRERESKEMEEELVESKNAHWDLNSAPDSRSDSKRERNSSNTEDRYIKRAKVE